MKSANWKKLLLPNLPYLLFVYLFDKAAQAARLAPGADFSGKLLSLGDGFAAAFASAAPSLAPIDLLVGVAGAVLIRLIVYFKGKNAKKYRKGVEYGSARWGNAEDIKPYIDPVFENNVLLTQTERLMMSSRPKQPKYARNKNVLVIGGSGSGKTRFFVKPKKRIDNDRENWVVFQDVHEAIIERAVYEQVQQKRGKIRKRRTNNGERNLFSGLLVCADCGSNLHFHFNQGNPDIKYFNCSNYKGNRGTCTSTHYVRVDFLEQVVLGEIRRLTKFASHYEDDFVKAVMGSTQESVELDRRLKQKELAALQARDEELDGLFERVYEDNVSGKLSDDRFAKMSRRYEQEQKELAKKIRALRSELDKLGSREMTSDMFISTVRKYTRAKKLTPRMLNELIERIEVHQAEKTDGKWEQRLNIHYNCVGAIFIPDVFPLPAPQVSVNTRKGVVVNYAPCQIAI